MCVQFIVFVPCVYRFLYIQLIYLKAFAHAPTFPAHGEGCVSGVGWVVWGEWCGVSGGGVDGDWGEW